MKLKYKKMILLTTMSTMGIGMLTLSINHDQPKAQESSKMEEVSTLMNGAEDAGEFAVMEANLVAQDEPIVTPMPTEAPTPSPTPTPFPVSDLEELEQMDALFVEYYNAKAGRDIGRIASLCSDSTKSESLGELEKKVKYIEEYKNIKSYSKKSYEPGAYIVYVYYDIKFARINTLAPSLSKFYVVTDEEGNFRIYSEQMNQELKEYFDARNGDEDVLELIVMTDDKADKAKEKDEDLMIFWTGLDELSQMNSEEGSNQAQGDAATE